MKAHKFSTLLSYLFHPLLVPLYGFLILFAYGSFVSSILNTEMKALILTTIVLLTLIMPAFMVVYLKRKGSVDDYELSDPKQRTMPYVFTLICYVMTYFNLSNENLPTILSVFMVAACISLLAVILLNFVYKISAHMIGMSALTASLLYIQIRFQVDTSMLFLLFILLSGLVGFARLRLNAHTPLQVYSGFVVGFVLQYISLAIFL